MFIVLNKYTVMQPYTPAHHKDTTIPIGTKWGL